MGAQRQDIQFNFGRRGNGKRCQIFLGKMIQTVNWKKGKVLPALPSPKWGYVYIWKFKGREIHEITRYVQKIISICITEFRRYNRRMRKVVIEDVPCTISNVIWHASFTFIGVHLAIWLAFHFFISHYGTSCVQGWEATVPMCPWSGDGDRYVHK